MTTRDYGLARRMWHRLEPIHAVFWYAPAVFALLGAAFESGLLPSQSTLGIATVPPPAPRT
jgi:hypothetical protein